MWCEAENIKFASLNVSSLYQLVFLVKVDLGGGGQFGAVGTEDGKWTVWNRGKEFSTWVELNFV